MGVGYAGQSRSVAWGDYDNDGWIDLYVGNHTENSILYRNRLGAGGLPFLDVTGTAGVANDSGAVWAVLWGDYDNDGDLDLHVANDFEGPNRLFRNDGSVFTQVQDSLEILGHYNGMGLSWCDYDRDGDLDSYEAPFWEHHLYRNDGSRFADIAPAVGAGELSIGWTVAWADFDNDGDSDFFCANSSCFPSCGSQTPGESRLYRNDGSTLTDVTIAMHPSLADDAVGAAWGDYDNDGDTDLFVAKDGPDHLFRNDGATFSDVAAALGVTDAGLNRGGIWGDYDLDKDLDLFVTGDGPSKLYRNDGATFTEVGAAEGVRDAGNTGYGGGAGWADYDNDGDLDLYVVREGGTNRLFRNDQASGNRWLTIKTVGVAANRDGIGTRVLVIAGGVSMTQEVTAGEGYCSQNSFPLEFGLGSSTTASLVQAVWPTGLVQTLTNQPTNTTLVLTEPAPAVKFQDVAASAGVADAGDGRGVAWGDYDGDADLDLFLSNFGPDRLFRNDAGAFTEVGAALGLTDGSANSKSTIWIDYNNDGHLDLYVSNLQGASNRLWKNMGSGNSFQDVAGALGIGSTGLNNWGAAWVDFDRDGDVDLYQTRKSQPNSLYRNDGAVFTDVAPSLGVNLSTLCKTAAWGDYDGDGWPDLYVVTDSADVLFRSNAGASFTDATATAQISGLGEGRGASWGDFDNDGDLDLFVANNGPSRFYVNNGNGTFASSDIAWRLGFSGNDYCPAWADFDGDKDLDLTLTTEGGIGRLMEKAGTYYRDVAVQQGIDDYGTAQSTAWADYDGDGDIDLYTSNANEPNHLYRRTASINSNWLRIRLVGTASNRVGIGATVRVTAGGVTQTRVVDGGSGWLTQGGLWPHLFLGSATSADLIVVTWPSGIVDQISNVAPVNRTLVLTEGVSPTGIEAAPTAPTRFALHGVTPNPFRSTTTILYDVPRTARVVIDVFDTQGRRIRRLSDTRAEAGRRAVRWDGRDDAGREAAAGVYLVRFSADAFGESRKVTLLR
jgi:hypothetical protein